MKRTPLRRVSEKQLARLRGDLASPKAGPCGWCGRSGPRVNDHIVPRSLLPGPNRDHRDNLMAACRRCNGRRAYGWRPAWTRLSPAQQRFVMQMRGAAFAARYFRGVPE